MNLTTSASMSDASTLLAAVQQAGGTVPDNLANIVAGAQLVNTPTPLRDPAKLIVSTAADGKLTQARLEELMAEAARASAVAEYAASQRDRIEKLFAQEFHRALDAGGADSLLDSVRPAFDQAAAEISAARALIPVETRAEDFLHSARPETVTAWQGLNGHLATVSAIAAIASAFGPRLGRFPLVEEYSLGDGYKLHDAAILCTDGDLVADSALFHRSSGQHRSSPWFRAPLKLHSVASARDRYRQWASHEWERLHSGPVTQWLDDKGQPHDMKRPANPYREPEPAH